MDTLFTWEVLATLAGASGITYLIVAYTKRIVDSLPVLKIIGTDLYAVFIGFLVLLGATAALGQVLTWANVVLALLNGFLVAATAGKMSDKAVTDSKQK
ncbi:MAG TPA: hypothetical protein GX526_04945 [Thermoanaerobacterales bacterium]|nr:hypothetical protein [Thermoanaerobacterales bacterium]